MIGPCRFFVLISQLRLCVKITAEFTTASPVRSERPTLLLCVAQYERSDGGDIALQLFKQLIHRCEFLDIA